MFLLHAQSTSKSKSTYFCLSHMRNTSKSGFGKFWYKSFSYSWEKSERPCFFCFFSRLTKSGTLRGYPYFQNALLLFMIFRNKYGTAVTCRHVYRIHLPLLPRWKYSPFADVFVAGVANPSKDVQAETRCSTAAEKSTKGPLLIILSRGICTLRLSIYRDG